MKATKRATKQMGNMRTFIFLTPAFLPHKPGLSNKSNCENP